MWKFIMKKILIVDSEIETRRLLDEQLTTAGYKTVLSTNGRDGLNSFFMKTQI